MGQRTKLYGVKVREGRALIKDVAKIGSGGRIKEAAMQTKATVECNTRPWLPALVSL